MKEVSSIWVSGEALHKEDNMSSWLSLTSRHLHIWCIKNGVHLCSIFLPSLKKHCTLQTQVLFTFLYTDSGRAAI